MDFKTHHSAMPSRHSSISQLKTEYSIGTGHMANPHLYLRLGKGWFMVALQPADLYYKLTFANRMFSGISES